MSNKVKLHIDEVTKKITGYTSYPIDEELDDYVVNCQENLFGILVENTLDAYLEEGEVRTKPKDANEYYNRIASLNQKRTELMDKADSSKLLKKLIEKGGDLADLHKEYTSAKEEIKKVEEEIKALTQEHDDTLKALFKQKNEELDASVTNTHYSSICLLIKDENEYLIEWLAWHVDLGIDHFYIYDNGSEVPVSEIVMQLPPEVSNKITVVDWSGTHEHMQHDCYNHCLKTYGHESTWIAFIDSDEFIRLTGECKDINSLLSNFEEEGSLYMHWLMYNANGKEHKEDGLVRERFTTLTKEYDENSFGKLFIKPTRIKKMMVHWAVLKSGSEIADEKGNAIGKAFFPPSRSKIVVDHYYTKSYEEWCKKMLRGSCDPDYHRKYDEFFRHNPDMMHLYDENFLKEQGYDA